MRTPIKVYFSTLFTAFFVAVFATGSIAQSIIGHEHSNTNELTVVSTSPSDGEEDVSRNIVIKITFSEDMDSTAMKNSSFTLMHGSDSVEGTMVYSENKGMFTTQKSLKAGSIYTAKMTTASNKSDDYSDEEFHNEESDYGTSSNGDMEWSFTTGGNSDPVGTVDLGTAADYVILAKSSIHNDSSSVITGEKGFDPDSKSSKENGDKKVYWLNNEDVDKEAARRDTTRDTNGDREHTATERDSDANRDNLDKAYEDMMTAYTDASDRSPVDFMDFKFTQSNNHADSTWNDRKGYDKEMNSTDTTDSATDRNTVDIRNDNPRLGEGYRNETDMDDSSYETSLTLDPGIYKWDESVEISTNITLSGSADDVWIFQISEDLTISSDVEITLSDGAVAENIFWQVAGDVTIGVDAHFEGIILSEQGITMENGASLNGRMLAQTDVTLDENTINEPKRIVAGQTTSTNE